MKFAPKNSNNTFYILPSHLPPMISSVESKLGEIIKHLVLAN